MAWSPRQHYVRALTCFTIFALALVFAGSAAAAESSAPNYALGPMQYAPGSPIICRGWSGGSDAAGHFYTACPGPTVPYVYEFDETGKYLRYAQLPANYLYDNGYRMRDVAVSPDGTTMYVNTGPIIDELGPNPNQPNGTPGGVILKFIRQLDGSWAQDFAWRSGPYLLGAGYWAPRFMDVDDSGRLYVAVNAFVYEISPANGAVVGSFGGSTTNGPGGAWIDGIDVAEGVNVAGDGNSLFVVEQRHNIVERWVRVPNVGWRRDTTWGPNGNGLLGAASGADGSACQRNDRFQSPYDIADDIAGDLYIADVTCHRIQRYDKNGNFVQTVWSNGIGGCDQVECVHGITVNTQGSVIIPELERVLQRRDPAKKVCVDAAAPTITGTGLGSVSASRALGVTVSGTDDCSGVTAVRVSGNVLGTPAWVDGASTTVQLSGWNGTKRLTIEARDASGKVSSTSATLTLALPQPTLHARSSVRLRTRGCRVGNPLKRVARASTYRMVARCSRMVGTVQKIKVAKYYRHRKIVARTYRVQLLLSTAAAQALYDNAVGPVRIWVVTDRTTRVIRAPRPRARAVIVGPLIAPRSRTSVTAIPVDAIA
jgi:hypothetical protein